MFFILPIIFEVVFVIVFVTCIIRIVKSLKSKRGTISKTNDELPPFQNTISNANDANSYGNSLSSEPTEVCCDYCGSKFNKSSVLY